MGRHVIRAGLHAQLDALGPGVLHVTRFVTPALAVALPRRARPFVAGSIALIDFDDRLDLAVPVAKIRTRAGRRGVRRSPAPPLVKISGQRTLFFLPAL